MAIILIMKTKINLKHKILIQFFFCFLIYKTLHSYRRCTNQIYDLITNRIQFNYLTNINDNNEKILQTNALSIIATIIM